ncbi:nematocin receptor 2-like [Mya arenaria]|uniref:nematocin receptor 2-like n=1 Tax=Mya arenaria TaxID=6604 RepID=UPI0022E25173|nr:nematocin receptor 2-like [Mya arenaria]
MGGIHLPTTTVSLGNAVNSIASDDNSNGLSKAMESELLDKLNDEIEKAVTPVSVFVGIEVFLGFFGNLFVLYVFIKRYHHCNFRYFVLCLAVLDLISTLTTMPGDILTQQYWYKFPSPVACKVKSFLNMFTVSGEALCLCTIAVDRYRKVCAPLGWQIRPRLASIMCGVIYCVAFVISFPVWFLWGIHHDVMIYNERNITVSICERDADFVDSRHPFVFTTTVGVLFGICLVAMLVLYILVAKKLILGRPLAKMGQNSSHLMVSKSLTSKTISNRKPEISAGGAVTLSDGPTKKQISLNELSKTEMRSLDYESETVNTDDVCVTDAETTYDG